MSNFREFFKQKLPENFWGEKYPWLQRLTHLTLLPYDIYLQVTEQIPRLRDLINHTASNDALRFIGSERKINKFSTESYTDYNDKLAESWNLWITSGSRYGLNKMFELSKMPLDSTHHEYGIEENLSLQYDGYWGENYMFWGHFYWGGNAILFTSYAIYVSDPKGILKTNKAVITSIKETCQRFAPAHCFLAKIYFTNGSGTNTYYYDLINHTEGSL